MEKPNTPNLDKMLEIQDKSQICGEFLEWLQKKYAMFRLDISRPDPFYHGSGDYINIEHILAEFFGIDLTLVEQERHAIIQYEMNKIQVIKPKSSDVITKGLKATNPTGLIDKDYRKEN